VKIVQAMLGHRSATQTLDRYGHLYPSDLDALAERLNRAHAAAMATDVWPQSGPAVIRLSNRPGQRPGLLVEVGRLELPYGLRLGSRA